MPGQQPTFKIRTSGYILFLFSVFFVICAFFIVFIVRDLINRGPNISILGIVLLGYGGFVFISMLVSQKIELTDQELIISSIRTAKFKVLPVGSAIRFKLTDVNQIVISRYKNLRGTLRHAAQTDLRFDRAVAVVGSRGVVLPIPLGYAAQYSPVLCVERKEGKPVLFPFKAYSNVAVRKFISECARRKIPVTLDPELKNYLPVG